MKIREAAEMHDFMKKPDNAGQCEHRRQHWEKRRADHAKCAAGREYVAVGAVFML